MMKLLALTALFTFVFALSAEIEKRQMDILPPGACMWDNVVYEHSENIPVLGTISCTGWMCLNGKVVQDMTLCGDIYGLCRYQGEKWSEGNCLFYRCQRLNDTVSSKVFRYTGCTGSQGYCHDEGASWVEGNCLFYECQRVKDTVSQRVFIYTGCLQDGDCYGLNASITWGPCQEYRCILENNQPRMVLSEGCQDPIGVCRKLGEWFSYHIGNIYHDNCTCEVIDPTRATRPEIRCRQQ